MPLSWHKRRPRAHVTTIRSNAFLDEQSAKTPTGQQSGCPVQSTQQVLGECAPRIGAPRAPARPRPLSPASSLGSSHTELCGANSRTW